MFGNVDQRKRDTAAARNQPPDSPAGLPNACSEAIADRARRVIWKGGKEATQHPSLRDCGLPRFLARGKGHQVWDVDGHCYTDYLMTWGAVLLGHANPTVESAVARQLAVGSHLNLPVEQEVALAERLVEHIPGAEMVRLLATGAEATTAAVRIARAATGRDKLIQYGFHGWLDWSQSAHPAGILPAAVTNTLSMPFNDLEALGQMFETHGDSIAAVIMEPVKEEEPAPGYLAGVRELAHRFGALLIFDEAKTGFRFGLGGAQAHYGVSPDLAVFSKALANGYPLAVVTGQAEVFRRASDAWISGTYHGWPPAIAAALAALSVLEREPVVQHVWSLGTRLIEGFNEVMVQNGLESRLVGPPPMPQFQGAATEAATIHKFFVRLVARGNFVHPIRPWFISFAHDLACIEQTIQDVAIAAREAVAT